MKHTRLSYDAQLVTSIAWHPQSSMLFLGFSDGSVAAWDVCSSAEIARFCAHSGKVGALACSPDGKRLATGGEDGQTSLWETDALSSRAPASSLAVSLKGPITALAWSPDQTLAASNGTEVAAVRDGSVLWRQQSPRRIDYMWWGKTLLGGGDGVFTLDGRSSTPLRAEGPVLALSFNREESEVTLAGLATGELLELDHPWEDERVLANAKAPVSCWSVVPARAYNWMVSGHEDGTVAVYLQPRGQTHVRPHAVWRAHHGPVRSVLCSPDAFGLVTLGRDGVVSLWRQGEASSEELAEGRDLDLSETGARLLTTYWSIQIESGAQFSVDDPDWNDGFRGASWLSQNELVALDGFDANLRRFDASGNMLALRRSEDLSKAGPVVDRHGRIAIATNDRVLVLDDAFGEIRSIETSDEVIALAWSSTGLLAGLDSSDTLTVWDDRAELWSRPGALALSGRQALSWSPDGSVIAVVGNPAVLVDVATQHLLYELPGAPHAIAFSPDGQLVAVGSMPDVVTIWAWREQRPVAFWRRSTEGTAGELMVLAWRSAHQLEIVTKTAATSWSLALAGDGDDVRREDDRDFKSGAGSLEPPLHDV